MPDTSEIKPVVVSLGGGLILDRDDLSLPPGAAITLQNFEPSVQGGYRRLSGTAKWNSNQVNGSEKLLGLLHGSKRFITQKLFVGVSVD